VISPLIYHIYLYLIVGCFKQNLSFFLGPKINLITVLSSLSIEKFLNPGTKTKLTLLGATNPHAITTVLIV
jgi:hypothetical protein